MAFTRADWKDVSTAISTAGIILAGVGASLPDPYSKIIMGLSVGLTNGALVAYKHGHDVEPAAVVSNGTQATP